MRHSRKEKKQCYTRKHCNTGYLFTKKLKCAESKADTQQHLHKQSAEAVVAGQTPMGAHCFMLIKCWEWKCFLSCYMNIYTFITLRMSYTLTFYA